MQSQFTTRENIIEVVNKLFVYTDTRRWQDLQDYVFTDKVLFDMSSLGAGEPASLPANVICDKWRIGFEGIDAVHHQAGNYLVTVKGNEAIVHAYAIAVHYKASATQGSTREFVGNYELRFTLVPDKGWRINSFAYYLKYSTGNLELK